jgi:hypothetical protein
MQLKETGWRPEMPPVALNAPSSERPLEAMGQERQLVLKLLGVPLRNGTLARVSGAHRSGRTVGRIGDRYYAC